jgi:hypothetical protein
VLWLAHARAHAVRNEEVTLVRVLSDSEWHALLEDVGLLPRPARRRPPPGTPWPPVVPEPEAEEPVEDRGDKSTRPRRGRVQQPASERREEPKPKKERGGGNDDVV